MSRSRMKKELPHQGACVSSKLSNFPQGGQLKDRGNDGVEKPIGPGGGQTTSWSCPPVVTDFAGDMTGGSSRKNTPRFCGH